MSKKVVISLVSLAAAGIIPLAGTSLVNAATVKDTIPVATFHSQRLAAEAQVLNTTTANVQAALKAKTLKQSIASAGLTKTSFHQKVKAQLTTDLEAKGYSQAEVTAAFKHHHHRAEHRRQVKATAAKS